MLPCDGMLREMLQSKFLGLRMESLGEDAEASFLQEIMKCSPGPHPEDTIHPSSLFLIIPRLDPTSSATS